MTSPFSPVWIASRHLARRVAALGVGAGSATVASFVAGLAAMPLLALRHYWPGLTLIVAARAISLLALAMRRSEGDAPSAGLAAAFDPIVFAGVPFAFALADPSRALAAAFLLFAFVAAGAAGLTIAAKRGIAAIDETICLAAFAFACVVPDRFSIVAYALGVAGFIAAGARIASGLARSGS